MFYRDITLAVAPQDRWHFQAELLALLHEQHSRLQCALAFPDWQVGRQNSVDDFDTFTHYADTGAVVRLFSENAPALEQLTDILGIHELVAKAVVMLSRVKPAPTGGPVAAFCRDRRVDQLTRKLATVPAEHRAASKARVREALHTMAFVRMGAKDGGSVRSLYFTKVAGEQLSPAIATNSYGFSTSTALCFLPDF